MSRVIYKSVAVPRINFDSQAQLNPQMRWDNVTEAKAVVERINVGSDGRILTRKIVAEDEYEIGDDMTPDEFRASVQKEAFTLKALHEGLS